MADMDNRDILQKLSAQPLKQTILYNKKRLQLIESALGSMKEINKGFLRKYQLNELWNKLNIGLMKHSFQASLQNIVEFKVCESNKPERSFFNPFSKKPITICYNKFLKQEDFDRVLSYNLILYYDTKTKKKMNWNQLQDAVKTTVRAINLSGLCKSDDRACISEELKARVFEKQRFRGKTLENLSQVIMEGLLDATPVSQPI